MSRSVESHVVNLSTRHLYYSSEPAILIEIGAYSFAGHGTPNIQLSMRDITLEVGNEKLRPLEELRENPFMETHWRCGGRLAATSNLNVCGPAVLTFPKPILQPHGFTLHLGVLKIDGTAYEVPDIKYCYIPRTTRWVKFHG